MSVLNPRGVKIDLGGKEYEFLFTLNAIDQLQDESGMSLQECIKSLTEPETVTKMLRMTAKILINDYLERTEEHPEFVTDKTVGWFVTLENQGDVLVAILKSYGISMPDPEEDEEEEDETDGQDPNAESDHQNSTSEDSWWSRFLKWAGLREKSSE